MNKQEAYALIESDYRTHFKERIKHCERFCPGMGEDAAQEGYTEALKYWAVIGDARDLTNMIGKCCMNAAKRIGNVERNKGMGLESYNNRDHEEYTAGPELDDTIDVERKAERMLEVMGTLPRHHRALISDHFIFGFSVREACKRNQFSYEAGRKSVQRFKHETRRRYAHINP